MPEIFDHTKKPNVQKLLEFGFVKKKSDYIWSTDIAKGQFQMTVSVSKEGTIRTGIVDSVFDEYLLNRNCEAGNALLDAVRTDYRAALDDILQKCFDSNAFTGGQVQKVIAYLRKKHGGELEFLWKRSPDNAIVRRADTNKWYGALLTVSKRKLGLDSDEVVVVINLKIDPSELETIVDNVRYFRGYHMNKRHWLTVILDGSAPLREIYRRIDGSFALAVK